MASTAPRPSGIVSDVVLTQEQIAFVERKTYLKNVTAATLRYYGCTFKAFEGCKTGAEYEKRVVELKKRGVKAVSINSWLRCINSYEHWRANREAPAQRKCYAGCMHTKLEMLKVENMILATFSPQQYKAILGCKPSRVNDKRIQVLAALLLDTGLRVTEALNLHRSDVDLDSMQVRVLGKGRKERDVPLSTEGRKWMYLWMRGKEPHQYVFSTASGSQLSVRNAERDLWLFCEECGVDGVRCSPHTFRHTFAVSYIRAGGQLEYLRRILGHTSIIVTQRYLRSLTSEDVGNVHTTFSPLARM